MRSGSPAIALATVATTAAIACASPPGAPPVSARAPTYASVPIEAPPPALGVDGAFYEKFTSADGIPVVGSGAVPDEALLVARGIVIHMLSARPDLRTHMVEGGYRVGVMATSESTTDLPEQRDWKKPAFDDRRLTDRERETYYEPGGMASMTDREYWDRRARGMGGRYTTGAEENVLGYPDTRYFGENILVHEFSHAIHRAVLEVDPSLAEDLRAAYEAAVGKGLYVDGGTRHYAVNTIAEYWAEGTQWWFWSNFGACFEGTRVWTPDDLRAYDPALYGLLARVYPDHIIPADVYHGIPLERNLRSCG